LNATCPFLYYSNFLRVNEDDIDDSDSNPRMELLQEGFLASAACFLVCVTASHQESNVPKSLPPFSNNSAPLNHFFRLRSSFGQVTWIVSFSVTCQGNEC
jgi:hypothetical protein